MLLHLPTLLYTCIGALILSAGLTTAFSTKLKTYRGFWFWIAAQWLLAAGLLFLSLREAAPPLLPVAIGLLLQSPVMILVGLRRFYSRDGLPIPAMADAVVLALTAMLWLVSWVAFRPADHWIAAFMLGSLALHFYAAALASRFQEFRHSVALQALAVIEVAVASLQLLQLVYWVIAAGDVGAPQDFLLASALLVVVPTLLMVYLGPLMSWERTELALLDRHRKLRFLANMDALTNIPNRRRFLELAESAIATARPGSASVVMLDIDHFKQINDRHGHARGDEVLRRVAAGMRRTLRGPDVAGRLGGDEFALVLPATGASDACSLAARIVAELADHEDQAPVERLSLSFGIVQINADEALANAMRRADLALYEAKRQGRSRAVVASGPEDEPVFEESRPLGLAEIDGVAWPAAGAAGA